MLRTDDREVLALSERYALNIPREPLSGRSGELTGHGIGASLEFQDYREYVPGDDLRHIDWGAYARTDSLMIRLYREEVSPCFEIIVDGSRSMASSPEKESFSRKLASLFLILASRLTGSATLWWIGERPLKLTGEDLQKIAGLPFDSSTDLATVLKEEPPAFKRRSIRILISDFLFPHISDDIMRVVARDSSMANIIQIMSREEESPDLSGTVRLVDNESGAEVNSVATAQLVKMYKTRLERLVNGLRSAARRINAPFAEVRSSESLTEICREILLPTAILKVE